MNIRELRSYLRKNELEDRWWIQIEGKQLEYPVRITDMILRKGSLKNKRVAVRHESEFSDPNAIEDWEPVEFTDGIVLRTEKSTILAKSITDTNAEHPLDNLEEFKMNVKSEGHEKVIERIYHQLNKERNSLLEIESKLESIREQLAAKEQELIYREDYIDQCEDLLIDKASQQEERQAELDQVLEDMNIS